MEFVLYLSIILVAIYSTKVWEVRIEKKITVVGLLVGQVFSFLLKFIFLKIQISKLYYIAPLMMIIVLIHFIFVFKHINLAHKKFQNHSINGTGFLNFVFLVLQLLNILILVIYAYIAIGNLYCVYGGANYDTQITDCLSIFINHLIIGLTYSIKSLETLEINAYTLFAFCYQFCSVASIVASILPEIIKSNNVKFDKGV